MFTLNTTDYGVIYYLPTVIYCMDLKHVIIISEFNYRDETKYQYIIHNEQICSNQNLSLLLFFLPEESTGHPVKEGVSIRTGFLQD